MKRLAILLLTGLAVPALAGSIDWPSALRGVRTGDVQWLNQLPTLAAEADAKQAMDLEDALAGALTTNTTAALKTLRVIDAGKWPHMIGSDIVCVPPLDRPLAEIEAFYQHTRTALLETSDGAQCLWILEASMEELKAESNRNKPVN
ncbi:hypothetical protein [Scandinavium goeteborgense]|uniref:Uncharacterized protein n=1 Tax=Scandinavium goeteborgense TaxID=1851514 RepID=A0A4R6DW40_SCAGO|nr:hypothetical protein [Scandinavium goeteborgense]TDN49485.1 hypothetical protein EC847_12312 [Scandinavium goeteborgense]